MDNKKHIEQLSDIKDIMERSSRFISLSGLSGILAGCYALIGAFLARKHALASDGYTRFINEYPRIIEKAEVSNYTFYVVLGLVIIVFSLSTGLFFTIKRSKKTRQILWSNVSKRMLLNLLLPLATGGVFCVILFIHGYLGLIAPSTLIFYGLALINSSKYALGSMMYLGVSEIVLGLVCAFDLGNGLFYWSIGFGVLHIIYGTRIWWQNERE